MAFLILGLVLLVMKVTDFGVVATWSWWLVLGPFGLAVLWWAFVDATGRTQRRAIEKMEQKKVERRERALDNLGLGKRGKQGMQGVRVLREGARQLETDSTAGPDSRHKRDADAKSGPPRR